jgi:hypothetical protein
MNDRKRAAAAAHARQKRDAPVAWKEYRENHFRRLENMVRLREQRLRGLAQTSEQQEK